MKIKLKKFTEFSKTILPNEAKYLASTVKFVDNEKKLIINQLINNALPENKTIYFDESIDKRKYSYIKNWISKKLSSIDVDINAEWLLDLKKKILLDAIATNEEKKFLAYIQNYTKVAYNFQILYELVKEYKPYLLIRLRYKDHKIISDFINKFKKDYLKAKKINLLLYQATGDITSQYTLKNRETMYWERWLLKVFQTETIDGRNRYQAFVLLAFVYTNYGESKKLQILFNEIDLFFDKGHFYSRRILSNYYANRVLLHSRKNELYKAEYYAHLSIRQKNNDALMYCNNLVAILLKNNKVEQAYNLMQEFSSLYNETQNSHQKIGFCSYEIRVLTNLGNYKLAENKAKIFLKKYKNEILKHRWHHFFTSYFNVLIAQEKYAELLKISKKLDIESKEIKRSKDTKYIPNILWSIALSKYMEGYINDTKLLEEIKKPLQHIKKPTESEKELINKVIDRMSKNLPDVFLKLKSRIH